MNCLAIYRNDNPHIASPNSGKPETAHSRPQTFRSITGIMNIILPPCLGRVQTNSIDTLVLLLRNPYRLVRLLRSSRTSQVDRIYHIYTYSILSVNIP